MNRKSDVDATTPSSDAITINNDTFRPVQVKYKPNSVSVREYLENPKNRRQHMYRVARANVAQFIKMATTDGLAIWCYELQCYFYRLSYGKVGTDGFKGSAYDIGFDIPEHAVDSSRKGYTYADAKKVLTKDKYAYLHNRSYRIKSFLESTDVKEDDVLAFADKIQTRINEFTEQGIDLTPLKGTALDHGFVLNPKLAMNFKTGKIVESKGE